MKKAFSDIKRVLRRRFSPSWELFAFGPGEHTDRCVYCGASPKITVPNNRKSPPRQTASLVISTVFATARDGRYGTVIFKNLPDAI